MSEWAYRFTDFLTGTLLAEVPLGPGITLPDPLGEDGSFDATVNYRTAVSRDNGLGSLIRPYRTAVFCIRRTEDALPTVPWAGQVLKRSVDSSAGTVTLSCSQLWQWVGAQLIERDFYFEDVDQSEIVRQVLAYVLGRPGADIDINLGAGDSGITRTKDWRQRAGKKVSERFEPMMGRTNGPLLHFGGEYRSDVRTRFLLRQIISNNPPAANARRDLVFDFPNGNVSAYKFDEDGTEQPVTDAKVRSGLIRTIPDPDLTDLGAWTMSAALNDGFKKNDLVRYDSCLGKVRYFVAESDMGAKVNRRYRGVWSLATSNSEVNPYVQGDVVLYDDPDTDAACSLYYVATSDIQHAPDLDAHAASPVRLTGWSGDDVSPDGESRWNEINAKDRFVDVVHNIHSRVTNDDLLTDGWPRRTLFEKIDDTRHADDVDEAAHALIRGKGQLARTMTLQLTPQADPVYGRYGTGDYVWLQIDDPDAGVNLRRWSQIVQMDTTPTAAQTEDVLVTMDLDP